MQGLTMEYELTVEAIVRRAETLFAHKEIVTRRPDRSLHRTTYGETCRRARALGSALRGLGVERGDRVATLGWNTVEHLEAYLGVPTAGAVLHTLNLRLHPEELAWIAAHAGDRVLIVDESLLPLAEQVVPLTGIEHVIAIGDRYEELVASGDPAEPAVELDEDEAAAMCYTSGTTARPKGVLYSHRALVLHSLASLAAGLLGIRETDVVLPVVPMFHANAWGLPYTSTLAGATLVLPGPHLDPPTLVETLESERVTITGGVPTIWLGILELLDSDPGRYDLTALRSMVVGGSAAPRSLIEGFERRHGLHVCHAWGMTEMAPLGTVAETPSELAEAGDDERFAFRATQGRPAPLVEIRARGEDGVLVAWDGETMGELEVRGVWIARAYHDAPDAADRWTNDGWFKTGDIVTIDRHGSITIQDRAKDVIKSGGEWISSVALENALMAHPAVAEAAVIGVPDEHWQERPLAVVVLRGEASADELREFLAKDFAKWQLPERFEFIDEIPKTAVGKFRKTALRERFATDRTPA